MLSVFSTLKETFVLWSKHFRFLVIVTLIVGTISGFLTSGYFLSDDPKVLNPLLRALLLFIGQLVGLVFSAMSVTAILGFLSGLSVGRQGLASASESIKANTWTLFRLFILLGLIAVPFMLVFALMGPLLGFGSVLIVIMVSLELVFLKYALAYPLVVVEKLRARSALRRSWGMTKGYFWYVAGCYIFLGAGEWVVDWAMSLPLGNTNSSPGWIGIVVGFASNLIDTLWTVQSWVMYLRLKEVEVARVAATVSPA